MNDPGAFYAPKSGFAKEIAYLKDNGYHFIKKEIFGMLYDNAFSGF